MNKENIIEFSKDDITFYGDTEEEKKKNEMMFDLTMENDRLHQELDKYKNVIDKIKKIMEADLSNMQKLIAINIMLKKDELLEEVE